MTVDDQSILQEKKAKLVMLGLVHRMTLACRPFFIWQELKPRSLLAVNLSIKKWS